MKILRHIVAAAALFSCAVATGTKPALSFDKACQDDGSSIFVCIKFCNQTAEDMKLVFHAIAHGVWEVSPPSLIAAQTCGFMSSESEGVFTGTQAGAIYNLGNSGTISIEWDDPFAGSDSYACYVPDGHGCTWPGDGSGADVELTMTLD